MAGNFSTLPMMTASIELSHDASDSDSNSWMRCIGEIRRERLKQLQAETGATFVEMNEKLGRLRSDATLSQIATQQANSGTGKVRQMGDVQARAIERAFGKPEGWMDRDPEFEALLATVAANPGLAVAEPPAAYGLPGLSPSDLAELDPQRRQEVANYIRERLALQRLEKFSNAAEPLGKRAAA